MADPQSIAAALYDGGWRAADLDQLQEEYDYLPDDPQLEAIYKELCLLDKEV